MSCVLRCACGNTSTNHRVDAAVIHDLWEALLADLASPRSRTAPQHTRSIPRRAACRKNESPWTVITLPLFARRAQGTYIDVNSYMGDSLSWFHHTNITLRSSIPRPVPHLYACDSKLCTGVSTESDGAKCAISSTSVMLGDALINCCGPSSPPPSSDSSQFPSTCSSLPLLFGRSNVGVQLPRA